MTGDRSAPDLTIKGARGAAFEVVLPNFSTAGYRWHADYDEQYFEKMTVERSSDPPHPMVFRFLAKGGSGDITFNLSRNGRPAEQTRRYRVVVEP